MINNPKFQQHLNKTIQSSQRSESKGRHGIIMGYDSINNTATVALSSPDSDVIGDMLRNVPCPVQLGIQSVAPEPGRPCWIVFKNNRDNKNAVITHYFNHVYNQHDYQRQTSAMSGIPNFLQRM